MSRPNNTNKNTKPILEKEYKQLIIYTNGLNIYQSTKNKWIKTIEILWITGLRVSELLDIKVKDIKEAIEKSELRVYISKQNIIRHIPLSKKSVLILKRLIENDTDDAYVFHKRNCKQSKLNSISFTFEFNKYLQTVLNSKDYSSHSFRKGLITQMSMKGINPKITQTLIGHKSVTTTLNYYRPTIDDVRECLVR